MTELTKVSVRELQHKLAEYLEIAKVKPLLVTKHGKDSVILANPKNYKIVKTNEKKNNLENIMSHPFIGMHKNRKDWKNKSTAKIAEELRYKAWYGK